MHHPIARLLSRAAVAFFGLGVLCFVISFLASSVASVGAPPVPRCADAKDLVLPYGNRDIRVSLQQDCWSGWLTPPDDGNWRCDPMGQTAVQYELTNGQHFYEGPGHYNQVNFPANPVFRVRGAGQLLCAVASSHGPQVAAPTYPEPERLTRPLANPSIAATVPFQGKWTGLGTKDPDPPYGVTITVTGGTGTIDYHFRDFDCGGTLELKEERPDFVFYRETISYGREHCVDTTIRALAGKDHTLDLTWYDGSGRATGDHALLRHPPDKQGPPS